MTRMMLLSAAVLTLAAVSSPSPVVAQDGAKPAPAATQLKSGQGPVACDCTNCSAPHCVPPGPFKIQTMTSDMQNAENVPSSAQKKPGPKKAIQAK